MKNHNHNMNSIECNNYYGAVTFIEEIIKTLAFRKMDKTNLQHNKLLDDVIMIMKN